MLSGHFRAWCRHSTTISARLEPPTSHHAGAGHDQAVLTLGIEADLRTVFNWNVKQLFVYVTAEYEVRHWVRGQGQG